VSISDVDHLQLHAAPPQTLLHCLLRLQFAAALYTVSMTIHKQATCKVLWYVLQQGAHCQTQLATAGKKTV
jgi:hypothetical protein